MPQPRPPLATLSLWVVPPIALALTARALIEGHFTLAALASAWCYTGARAALLSLEPCVALCVLPCLASMLSPLSAQPLAPPLTLSARPYQGGVSEREVIAWVEGPWGVEALTARELSAARTLEERAPLHDSSLHDSPLHDRERTEGDLLKRVALERHLAREASREPLSASARWAVAQARERAMVWAYLKRGFEPALTEATIPERYVEEAKRRNITLFRRPPLREASHVLLMPSFDPALRSRPPKATALDHERLAPVARKVWEDLKRDPLENTQALEARATRYKTWLPEGYDLRVEHLGLFVREGRFVRAFSEACFALPEGEQLTAPIETEFGVHVAWVTRRLEALDTPDEVIDAEVRARSLTEVRQLELNGALERLRERVVWVDEGYFLSDDAPEGHPSRAERLTP